MTYQTIQELGRDVDDAGGFLAVKAADLLPVIKWSNWAKYTANDLVAALQGAGLDYFGPMAKGRNEMVRIYRTGSAAGRVIEAVKDPKPATDDLLRRAADGSIKLERIRALLEP